MHPEYPPRFYPYIEIIYELDSDWTTPVKNQVPRVRYEERCWYTRFFYNRILESDKWYGCYSITPSLDESPQVAISRLLNHIGNEIDRQIRELMMKRNELEKRKSVFAHLATRNDLQSQLTKDEVKEAV